MLDSDEDDVKKKPEPKKEDKKPLAESEFEKISKQNFFFYDYFSLVSF